MANPKRRHTRSRRDKRRAHWVLRPPHLVECPSCHQPRLPHRACPNCGKYDGRQVLPVAEEAEG